MSHSPPVPQDAAALKLDVGAAKASPQRKGLTPKKKAGVRDDLMSPTLGSPGALSPLPGGYGLMTPPSGRPKRDPFKPRKTSIQVLLRQPSRGGLTDRSTTRSKTTGTGHGRSLTAARAHSRGASFFKSAPDAMKASAKEHMEILQNELRYLSDEVTKMKPLEIKIRHQFDKALEEARLKGKGRFDRGLEWNLANEIIGELSMGCVEMHQDLGELEVFKEDVREEVTELLSKMEDLATAKDKQEFDNVELEMRNEQLAEDIQRYEETLADMRSAKMSMSGDADKLKQQKLRIGTLEDDVRMTEGEKEALNKQLLKTQSELQYIQKDYAFATKAASDKAKEVEALSQKLETAMSREMAVVSDYEIQLDAEKLRSEDKENKLQARIAELEDQLEDTERTLRHVDSLKAKGGESVTAMYDDMSDPISPGGARGGVDAFDDGMDGTGGHSMMMSLDQMEYEYSDDNWLSSEGEEEYQSDSFEAETTFEALEMPPTPEPKPPAEDSFETEKAFVIQVEEHLTPSLSLETQKLPVIEVAMEPSTPDPASASPVMLQLICFYERSPIIGEPHLLNYLDEMKKQEPVVVRMKPKAARPRKIIAAPKQQKQEAIGLKSVSTRVAGFYKGKQYGGGSEVVRGSSMFSKLLGQWKQDETDKPGAPGTVATAHQFEMRKSRAVYDQKRGLMVKLAKKRRTKGTDAASGTRVEEYIVKRKVHKMKPRCRGYLAIHKSSIVPDLVLKKRRRYFFCLDGLPQNTNVNKREADYLKDREGEPLVPSLFFFESEAAFQELVRNVGGFSTRSIMFQKNFALYCVGILQLHCRGFSDKWATCYRNAKKVIDDLTVDKSLEQIALQRAAEASELVMFCIGKGEVTVLEAESEEVRSGWVSKIESILAKREKRMRRKKDTIVDELMD